MSPGMSEETAMSTGPHGMQNRTAARHAQEGTPMFRVPSVRWCVSTKTVTVLLVFTNRRQTAMLVLCFLQFENSPKLLVAIKSFFHLAWPSFYTLLPIVAHMQHPIINLQTISSCFLLKTCTPSDSKDVAKKYFEVWKNVSHTGN